MAKDYRNIKDWMQRVPAVPDETLAPLIQRVNTDRLETWGVLHASIELHDVERLYGATQDLTEFWRDMEIAQSRACRVLYMKKTAQGGTLFVIQNPFVTDQSVWTVPAEDVTILPDTDERVVSIKAELVERERLRVLRDSIKNIPRTAQQMLGSGQQQALDMLRHMEAIAKVAFSAPVGKVPQVKEAQVDRLLQRFSRVDVFDPAMAQDYTPHKLGLRLTQEHLMVKYASEGSGRVHASLDGTSIDIGKVIVDIGWEVNTSLFPIEQNQLHFTIWGEKNKLSGHIHPHISCSSDRRDGLWRGHCCLGSYGTPMKDIAEKGDVMGLVDIIHDYLTSCSENGWYVSMAAWLPEDTRKLYCRCGRTLWSEQKKTDTSSPLCGCPRAAEGAS